MFCPSSENTNMILKNVFSVFMGLAFLFAAVDVRAGQDACEEYVNAETRHSVNIVHQAVALIESEGTKAFKEFSVKGSQWFHDDKYIFVHALDGRLLCNPAFPQMVGSQMIDFKDVVGKPPVQFMIDQVTTFGRESGWIHYLWPIPGEVETSWKSSYVHLAHGPDGEKYLVGIGLYNVPMERCFAVQAVDEAAMLIEREGEKAFETLRSRTGPFVWKNSYVFVIDMNGTEHVNPAQPKLEGTKVSGVTDVTGDAFVARMLKEAQTQKSFWITYMWPKPARVAASKKHAYVAVVRSGGKQYMVGCGIYLDSSDQ